MRIFGGFSELPAAVGEELGTSDWVAVEQAQIRFPARRPADCVVESIVRFVA